MVLAMLCFFSSNLQVKYSQRVRQRVCFEIDCRFYINLVLSMFLAPSSLGYSEGDQYDDHIDMYTGYRPLKLQDGRLMIYDTTLVRVEVQMPVLCQSHVVPS
jgi:hypothetical protein